MGIFDKLKGEFIDIVEWISDDRDTMVYRFERYQNEIKNGAQLVVRESQLAVFIDKGKIADIFEPGQYQLNTDNLPILSTLQGWKYGFNSPFKAEVYFVSTKRFVDLKWGTKNPITLRDPEFGACRIRAFGSYVIRVTDPAVFIKEIVGTDGDFNTTEISDQLRNLIVSRFADLIGEAKIPILDMAANYDELGDFITQRIKQDFLNYGIELTKMLVENISLPAAVEEVLDKRTSMGIIGDLNKYSQFQSAQALEAAANNPSGGASAGLGMGMGFGMASQFMNQNQQSNAAPAASVAPPPLPGAVSYHVALDGSSSGPFDLQALKDLVAKGQLQNDTLVWKEGMAGWEAANTQNELSALFKAVPPPLPPQ